MRITKTGLLIFMAGMMSIISGCAYREPCGPALPEHLRPAPGEKIIELKGDPVTFFRFFHCRARKGIEEDQYRTGVAYEQGYGVEPDLDDAIYWYRKAADAKSGLNWAGNSEVSLNVGPQTYGHTGAQYRLGMMYFKGYGMKQKFNYARLWFSRAAEQGHEMAKKMIQKMDDLNLGRGE